MDDDSSVSSSASSSSSSSSSSSFSSATSSSSSSPEKKTKTKKLYGVVRNAQRFSFKNMLRSKRVVAAEVIQRYVRGFLWRRAEERRLAREARIAKERNIRHVRRRQMERDYWWDSEVDTDNLHRYQLEDLLMRLGLATSGTREELLVRFKRWILHRAVIADVAVQCASMSVGRALNGSGGVYTLDAPTPTRRDPPLVQLRQFQGKGYTRLGGSFASDSVYAIDSKAQLFLLRGHDNYTDTGAGLASPLGPGTSSGDGGRRAPDAPAAGGGWLLSGRWFSLLKREAMAEICPGGHHTVCCGAGGDAYTWGLNPHGELGSNHALNMEDPQEPSCMTLLPAGERIVSVSAGAYHGAAVSASGLVYTWGCNTANELAQINTFTDDLKATFYSAPVCVELNAPEFKLQPLSTSLGQGSGEFSGSARSRDQTSTGIPEPIYHRWLVRVVSCGAAHTACADTDGRVLTWGCRDGGRLGRRNTAWPAPDCHPDDLISMSTSQKRRKQRPQQGAPPGEIDDLWVHGKRCVDLCCGAWHTLLLVTTRTLAIEDDGHTDESSPQQRQPLLDSGSKALVEKAEVFTFGSGITGQLGLREKTISITPAKVAGLPDGGAEGAARIVGVRAGTYVSAASDSNGQVWMWGSRGAGMFQPLPRKAELPKGRRAGGLVDFCCTRDCVVFATEGVGPEYFEEMVDLKIAAFRKERQADEATFLANMEKLRAEEEAAKLDKILAHFRGFIVRFQFAKSAVRLYYSKRIIDPSTGRRKRVYVNQLTGMVLRRRPRFLKVYDMEPQKQEEIEAATLMQAAVRRKHANFKAAERASRVYEECFSEVDQRPYW